MKDREALDFLQKRVANDLPDHRKYGRWVGVAALLGVTPARIYQWRIRGIATHMRPAMREVLNRFGCRLPLAWALPQPARTNNGGSHGRPRPKTRPPTRQQAAASHGRRRGRSAQVESRV